VPHPPTPAPDLDDQLVVRYDHGGDAVGSPGGAFLPLSALVAKSRLKVLTGGLSCSGSTTA